MPQFPDLLNKDYTLLSLYCSPVGLKWIDHEIQHQNKTIMGQITKLLHIDPSDLVNARFLNVVSQQWAIFVSHSFFLPGHLPKVHFN